MMIRSAHIARTQAARPFPGIKSRPAQVDRAALVAQQQQRVEELRFAKYQRIVDANPAIKLLQGHARFKERRKRRGEDGRPLRSWRQRGAFTASFTAAPRGIARAGRCRCRWFFPRALPPAFSLGGGVCRAGRLTANL